MAGGAIFCLFLALVENEVFWRFFGLWTVFGSKFHELRNGPKRTLFLMTIFDQLFKTFWTSSSTKKSENKKITIFFSLKKFDAKTFFYFFKNQRRSKKKKIVDMTEWRKFYFDDDQRLFLKQNAHSIAPWMIGHQTIITKACLSICIGMNGSWVRE